MAIKSVLDQDHENIELIVVDDGSTDHTATVLNQFSKISIIKQQNKGQGAARQTGLELAKGHYIASLDSDDFWEPNFISQSLFALKREKAAFSFANWTTQTPEGKVLPDVALDMSSYLNLEQNKEVGTWYFLDSESTRELFTRCSPAPSSSLLVDREFIKHGWRPSFRISDDWAFLLDIVIFHTGSTCVFSVDRLWTKQIDGSNICDRHVDSVAVCENSIHDLQALLSLHLKSLSEDEIEAFEKSIRLNRFDLAYAQSMTRGHRREAIKSGLECLRNQPNRATAFLFLKSLARAHFGFRK